MSHNTLRQLADYGQSIWLDYIRRQMIVGGELGRLIEEDGLRGVTSNPKIFDKAIGGSHDYDDAIRTLALEGRSAEEIYEQLAVEDVQGGTDLFRGLYDNSAGRHGFVSLEVSPHLAHDTDGTVAEARRLWQAVDRPNVLIKVPGTREGLPAIRQLIRRGINVNVTLLFGLPRYREVVEAYLGGLEDRLSDGGALERVASVASFFLSRIDVLVDPMLERQFDAGGEKAKLARCLHGQVAVASAKTAYQIYKEMFASDRFRKLAKHGARTQRVLWASTSTKNPEYSDVKYVEALIGPETINTVPRETLDAYRDHGRPEARLEQDLNQAEETFLYLPELGIEIDDLTQQLEDEGVDKFIKPFDQLMESLDEKRAAADLEPVDRQDVFAAGYGELLARDRDEFEDEQFCRRFWEKDADLWSPGSSGRQSIVEGLGWLHVATKMEKKAEELYAFAEEVRHAGFRRVVHMGMGGSSLAPLVLQRSFTVQEGGLPLTVLDTTDPATVLAIQRDGPIEDTLFLVASKSGTTAEPRAFEEYFYNAVKEKKGSRAGENFVAITDPETPLFELARQRKYRRVFVNFSDIGGRYSALSYFGLVPAALMGLDVHELLVRALHMVHACDSCVTLTQAPGVMLGIALGEFARQGRDKVTFLVSPQIATFGLWLEQLLAESTGKNGTGLVPIAQEPLGETTVYGKDRVFVNLRIRGEEANEVDERLTELRQAEHPVVIIELTDKLDVGQEFFRWELATATAGRLLEINPFDQPNVQESKDNTNRLLSQVRQQGQLPQDPPTADENGIQIYDTDTSGSLVESLHRLFAEARPGKYLALMAYLTETEKTEEALQTLRARIRDRLHLATTLGYGPRFLHSTGQLHKGGPDTGVYVQLTADDAEDAGIPGEPYSFGVMKRAQAAGDLEALRRHGRRVVRIHLGSNVSEGFAALDRAVKEATAESVVHSHS